MKYVWYILSIICFVIYLFNLDNTIQLVIGLLLLVLGHLESIEEEIKKRNK